MMYVCILYRYVSGNLAIRVSIKNSSANVS